MEFKKNIFHFTLVAIGCLLSSCKPVGQIFSDPFAPTSPSLLINGGDTYTTSQVVTLSLQVKDIYEMYITNSEGCETGGVYEPFSSSRSWTLATTNNVATVYVKFKDRSGNESACVSDSIIHDSVHPIVSSVTSTKPNGSYKAGEIIPVQIVFSETINVIGIPKLTLETGETDRVILYSAGTGTNTLIFNYEVIYGETSADLDTLSENALELVGDSIQDFAGNAAVLTLPTPGQTNSLSANKAIVIDTSQPIVVNVTSSASNSTYKIGDSIPIQVQLSEPVIVTGSPQLTLETGAVDRVLNYSSGSGTDTLIFNYSVSSGDVSTDLDYQSTLALSLNGASIHDVAGNHAELSLSVPGSPGSLAHNKNILVDGISPSVSDVSSTQGNGTYKAGTILSIQISFNDVVNVTGTPQLNLETGVTDQYANYISGSGSSILNFEYIIQAGDTSQDLDYLSAQALSLNGGTLKDNSGNNVDLILPLPGAAHSLAANKNIVVDTTRPTITSVSSSTADGSYTVGDSVDVLVHFSETVWVSGIPNLVLETGTNDRVINYVSGSGTSNLTFSYLVQTGDLSNDLDYLSNTALALNGGTVLDAANNSALLTLPDPGAQGSLSSNQAIKIVPKVTSIDSVTASGSYTTGQVISIQLHFSNEVSVTGIPTLLLETGSTDRTANYVSGTGTSNLNFNYTVQSGDSSTDLDYTSVDSLVLNGGTIKDTHSNSAFLTLPTPGATNSLGANESIVIDTALPIISNVTTDHANGIFKEGEVIDVKVTFSKIVNLSGGTPSLTLETGSPDQAASYLSGTGTSELVFRYIVQTGDFSNDLDYVNTNSLSLNGAQLIDGAGNAAQLNLPAPGGVGSLGSNKAIAIDTAAPSAPSLIINSGANYTQLNFVDLQIFAVGATSMLVTNNSSCNAQPGEQWEDYATSKTGWLLSQNNSIASVYVKFKDVAGNESSCVGDSITHDNIAPTVSYVDSTASDPSTYTTGDSVSIQIHFSESVSLDTSSGTPSLTLALQNANRNANCSSSSGNSISCQYLVSSGDYQTDLNYKDSNSLILNGGTLKDLAGNSATVVLPATGGGDSLKGRENINIDSLRVTQVTSTSPNGVYIEGQTIAIKVVFSSAVQVTGTPTLELETGNDDAIVEYSSGSGTQNLIFNYLVRSGDTSLDLSYKNENSLSLNGGTIKKNGGTETANLALATNGQIGSLSYNKAIVVDTSPVISYVTANKSNGSYSVGEVIPIQVVFSEIVNVSGTPKLTLETGSEDAVINYSSGSGSQTLVFNYTVAPGHHNPDLNYLATNSFDLNGATIQDQNQNSANVTLPALAGTNSLSGQKNIVIDTPPTITEVTSSTGDGNYGLGDSILIDIHFSESVTVTGTPILTLETGLNDRVVNCASGTGLKMTCTYVVQAGDHSDDLEYVASGLALGAGVSIKDSGGNHLDLTSLPAPGAVHSLSANQAIVIDPIPVVVNVTSSKSNGIYPPGTLIPIQVVFSEAVTVSGTPTLDLATGGVSTVLDYVSGSGSTTLTFNYSVGGEDYFSDLDCVDENSLKLNGSTILSATSQNAGLTLPSPGLSGSLSSNKEIKSLVRSIKTGTTNSEHFASVLSSGDVNGDGKTDLVVGIPEANSGDGKLIVYSGLNGEVLYQLSGSLGSAANFAASIATVDVNSDGKADIVVGSPLFNDAGTERGKVTVFSGNDGVELYSVIGTQDGDRLGSSVASVGDIDGDSYGDFIVGVPYSDQGGANSGRAVVYSGIDGSEFGTVTGNESNALMGYSVTGVGDINLDGTPDFMISSPYASALGTSRGRIRVYSGKTFDVLYNKVGVADNDHFGKTISGGSDINGDGYPDFMVGSPDTDAGGTDRGQVLIYSGATGAILFSKSGISDHDQLGFSASFLGNVDGISGGDFILGIPGASAGGNARGQALVYSGHDGSLVYTLNGSEDNSALGRAVVAMTPGNESDANDDFAVGIPFASGSGVERGKVILYR